MSIEGNALWVVLAIGILGAIFGLAQTGLAKPAGTKPRVALGYFIWPNSISAALVAVSLVVLLLTGRIPGRWLPGILIGLALGWLLLFFVFMASRANGRKLASDVPVSDADSQARTGYNLLSASGFFSYAAPLVAVTALLAFVPRLPIEESMAIEALLALVLGFWVAAAFWSLPSALYRGVLAQETDAGPTDLGGLCVRFRSASGEMAFLVAAALAVAVAMGMFRFPEGSTQGTVYALGTLAGTLVFGLLVNALLRPNGRPGIRPLHVLGMVVFLAGTGLVSYYLATKVLNDIGGFYSFGIGLLTAMLLMLTARYRPPFVSVGSPFGIEIAIAEALMILAAVLLAFRWMAGYGVAVCTLGFFSSFVVLFPIGTLWAVNHADGDSGESADLPFISHAASRFAEIVMAGGAFLLLVGLLRLFYERGGRVGVDITDPYPLLGLVIGASFPILLRSIALSGLSGRRAASFDREVLTGLGKWAAFRTLGIWLLAVSAPLLVALFWRLQASGAFLVGLAAAELFLILTLWLGEVRNQTDDALRYATRATHILSIGSAVVTVLFAPMIINATSLITRLQKIYALAAVFAVIFVWVFIVVLRRLKVSAGEAP